VISDQYAVCSLQKADTDCNTFLTLDH